MSIEIHKLIGEATAYDKKQMLEAKRPKSWLKSVSAFANGEGGTLIFGISDDDEIVGLVDAEGDAEKISEDIKSKLDPVPAVNLEPKEIDGKKLVLLHVYPGQETPYYYIGDKQRLAFVRVGNESVTADRIQLKSLVLKDLFNIGHNAKSMLFILVVFAVAFIPFSGVEGYIFVCAILCSMMIVTTFSFDDSSKWTRYAMIMPVSKKELVAGKFMVLAIFCAIGSLFGLIIGFIGGLITHKIVLDIVGIGELLFLTLGAWVISLIFGSMSIPLVFKFGAEKGRVLLLVSFFIPAGICFGIYQLLTMLGVALTDQIVFILLCCSPLLALAWCYVMYQISYRIFVKQEL